MPVKTLRQFDGGGGGHVVTVTYCAINENKRGVVFRHPRIIVGLQA